jgi:hypothetical protein
MFFQKIMAFSKTPVAAKKVLQTYLETGAHQNPKAYEAQSGGVLDMLHGLQSKFTDQRNALEEEEVNNKHNFDMKIQELTDAIQFETEDRDMKAKSKSEKHAEMMQTLALRVCWIACLNTIQV